MSSDRLGLWAKITGATGRALESGALLPIETEGSFAEQGGVRFLTRIASNLERKAAVRSAPSGASNPFADPDPDLVVVELSDDHRCLLNKFNVVAHHLLIVTRSFEHQERLLTASDLSALWRCMREYDSLGFYNGGEVAGASQPHKHLQLVPLPLAPVGPRLPIEAPLLAGVARGDGAIRRSPRLPFSHAFTRLDGPDGARREDDAGELLLDRYGRLLESVGLTASGPRQSGPYNLLLTRQWMLLVPRTAELAGSISINALGFAGSFFVRGPDELHQLERRGPMTLLEAVSGSLSTIKAS